MLRSHVFPQFDFNWQQLRQLAGEDADFETELLAMFLKDAENSLRQLELAIATNSFKMIEEVAHSLRGSSANVGASALASVARQLEQNAQRGQIAGAYGLLQQLQAQCEGIESYFQDRLQARR
jgi:histidine phosphotransfer protein HptB